MRGLEMPKLDQRLAELVNLNPWLECLYVLDEHGLQLSATACQAARLSRQRGAIFWPAARGSDQSLKNYYLLLKAGLERYVSDPYISRASGNLCLTISTWFTGAGAGAWCSAPTSRLTPRPRPRSRPEPGLGPMVGGLPTAAGLGTLGLGAAREPAREARMSQMRQQAAAGLKPGDSFEITRSFSQAETEAFGHLTRDYNPVHYEEGFCRQKGLDGLICHGLLVAPMVCQVGSQIAWLASGMSSRFRRPVYFGDTVPCRLVITEVDDQGRARAEAKYYNQHGELVQEVTLRGHLPSVSERGLLAGMIAAGDPSNPLA